MRFKILILTFILAVAGNSSQVAKEEQIVKQETKLAFQQFQDSVRIDLSVEILIEIPAKAMPKNSFVTVGVTSGNYTSKTLTFQDGNITGNARKIDVLTGGTLSYVDKIEQRNINPNGFDPEKGVFTIEVLRKKKVDILTYVFEWNKATVVYFDKKQKKQFTVTVNVVRGVTIID